MSEKWGPADTIADIDEEELYELPPADVHGIWLTGSDDNYVGCVDKETGVAYCREIFDYPDAEELAYWKELWRAK